MITTLSQHQTVLKTAPHPDIVYYTIRAIACYGALWRKHGPETAVHRKSKPDLSVICRTIRHSLVCPWAETPESKDQV